MGNDSPSVLSTFTGLGGLDLGLEAAGFRNVGCIEFDPIARLSLKANKGDGWQLIDPHEIVRVAAELTPDALELERGELTILAGGPPCQPFSKAAQWTRSARAGMADPRAKSLNGFLRLVETFLPRAILIENVSGFVRGEVSALDVVRLELSRINAEHGTRYRPEFRIVDTADYGVPQRRLRAIVVAFRDGGAFDWPTAEYADSPVTSWDAIGKLERPAKLPPLAGKWAELLPSIPEGNNYLWHTSRGGGKPLFGYRTRYWSFLLKLSREEPSWTLSAQPGPSTGPFHWDNRPLTIPEMLALQTFPHDWIVEGLHREQVRQVGNATPPLLGEIFGRALMKMLHGKELQSLPEFQLKLNRPIPAAAVAAEVPKRFLDLIGEYPDHPGAGRGPSPRVVDLTAPDA